MKKRIIAITSALVLVASFFTMNVNAENHFFEDFSSADALSDTATWVRVSNECPEKYSLTVDNGNLRFRKNVTAANPAPSDKKRFENKLVYPATTSARVWMFDFCEATDSTNVNLNGQWFFKSGWRIWYSIGQSKITFGSDPNKAEYSYTKGNWYSVMVTISEDYTNAEAYIKPQNGTVWTKFSTATTPSIVTGNVNYYNYVSLYENGQYNRYLDIRLDNIRFFNGENLTDKKFMQGTTTINNIEDISSGNLTVSTTLLKEAAPTDSTSLMGVFVAFDEDDMMVDFAVNPSVSVTGGVNSLSAVLDTQNYYDKLGYVGYYLWDANMQPYIDAIELD